MDSHKCNINSATLRFLNEHWDDDAATLALKAASYPDVDMLWVARQVKGRQKAKVKIPTWYANRRLCYPSSISMEQCSSEYTARYKAELCKGTALLDLTGGFGVDTAFMSAHFTSTTYVEQNAELAAIACHNFAELRLDNIEVKTGNGIEYLSNVPNKVDWIYIDPARRKVNQRKAVLLSDCEPDIIAYKDLLLAKCDNLLAKLSPLFDIAELLRFFPDAAEIHVVSVDNECKELLLLLDGERHSSPQIFCVNSQRGGERQRFSFYLSDEQQLTLPIAAGNFSYLYEPNASIQKSGGFKSLAHAYNLTQVHANSKLFVSENHVNDFPGRTFVIEAVVGFSKQELKQGLRGVDKANITVRNFPLTVAELRKKLGLKDGGGVYLFATTLADGKKVLIRCRKDR